MRSRRILVAVALAAAVVAPVAAEAPISKLPAVVALLDEAEEAIFQKEFKQAIRTLKEADKLAKGNCVRCQLDLAKAYNGVGAFKDAVRSADAALAQTTEASAQAAAWNERGLALFASGPDAKSLANAEAAFRKVHELSGEPMALFNLGLTLLRLERDPEGVAVLQQFLELAPSSSKAEDARQYIAKPLSARKRLLPDLELVTLGGEYLTTEDLLGKVVLLDFWGTWCAPCRASVPSLRNLAARYAEAPFALVSIANDPDGETLRKFIAENRMTWPQVWDREQQIVRKLNIKGYPTYLLVDHEGEIVFSASGWGETVEREVETRLRRAVATARREAARP